MCCAKPGDSSVHVAADVPVARKCAAGAMSLIADTCRYHLCELTCVCESGSLFERNGKRHNLRV